MHASTTALGDPPGHVGIQDLRLKHQYMSDRTYAQIRLLLDDLDLPGLTAKVVRQVNAETPPAAGFIFLWDDAEDLQRLNNVTLRGQCRFVWKAVDEAGSGKTETFLNELTQGILDFSSWKHGARIQDVMFEPARDMFLIVFRSGRSYKLRKKLVPGLDRTDIKTARPNEDGSSFLVEQESGNTSEIPWDFVLYHLEPEYAYYRGRRGGRRSEHLAVQRVARRLKEVRTSLGLTASAVAARSGIRRPNISRIERGKHAPSLETLERLADALGVPVSELVP
ncbi:MAG: helix-turn-helix domain-containing protein [Armatimonadota bacterium]